MGIPTHSEQENPSTDLYEVEVNAAFRGWGIWIENIGWQFRVNGELVWYPHPGLAQIELDFQLSIKNAATAPKLEVREIELDKIT